MSTIIGTSGQDVLQGTSGDDLILGRGGDDFLYGRDGNDTLKGGSGGDVICDREDIHKFGPNGDDWLFGGGGDDQLVSLNGADHLLGGMGNDDLVIYRQRIHNDDQVIARGGGGDDTFYFSSYNAGAHVKLDGGAGDDFVQIWGSKGLLHIDLGTGDDTVWAASRYADGDGPVLIDHFTAGDGGDHFALNNAEYGGYLDGFGEFYTGDPVADGHLRLVQHGHNVELQVDPNAGGNWSVSMIFKDANVADFTAANFDGYDPHPAGLVT
jgi:hypothetical protein